MTTNYDKIKNMTIDEMAEMITNFNINSLCDYCVGCECFSEDDKDICEKGLKQWLEQGCEDEN